uniref:Uncharacterized protein n=1 Tax=Pediastrum angulosum TaxID=271408 RepID=A0A2U8GHM8_9CHLO|nr:hypothetical protein [Pediastrum angulosum]AWI68179.1 hypothetical protein [Pediastrum angulosum]
MRFALSVASAKPTARSFCFGIFFFFGSADERQSSIPNSKIRRLLGIFDSQITSKIPKEEEEGRRFCDALAIQLAELMRTEPKKEQAKWDTNILLLFKLNTKQ